jgi:hypothetical protein
MGTGPGIQALGRGSVEETWAYMESSAVNWWAAQQEGATGELRRGSPSSSGVVAAALRSSAGLLCNNALLVGLPVYILKHIYTLTSTLHSHTKLVTIKQQIQRESSSLMQWMIVIGWTTSISEVHRWGFNATIQLSSKRVTLPGVRTKCRRQAPS